MSSSTFYMGDQRFPDLKIRSQGITWVVHKSQVCAKSERLEKEEKDAPQDGRQTLIMLDDYLPGTIHRVLNYIYYGDYDDLAEFAPAIEKKPEGKGLVKLENSDEAPNIKTEATKASEHETQSEKPDAVEAFSSQLLNNVLVAICAEDLEVDGLQTLAAEKICSGRNVSWDSTDILRTLESIYSRVSRQVQQGIAKACESQEALFPAAFEKISQEIPILAADVLKAKLTATTERCRSAEEKLLKAQTHKLAALKLKAAVEIKLKNEYTHNQIVSQQLRRFQEIEEGLERWQEQSMSIGKSDYLLYVETRPSNTITQTDVYQCISPTSVHGSLSFEELRLKQTLAAHDDSSNMDVANARIEGNIIAAFDHTYKALAAAIAVLREKCEDLEVDKNEIKSSLEAQVTSLTAKVTDLEVEKGKLNNKFWRFIQEPNNWDACRICAVEFNGSFKDGKGKRKGKYDFRCDRCGTPHGWLSGI